MLRRFFSLWDVTDCAGADGEPVISYLQSCFHDDIIIRLNREKQIRFFRVKISRGFLR